MRDFWLSESAPSWTVPDRLGKLFLASAASLIVANSQAVARALPVSRNVRVVHNGIDVQQFSPGQSGATFRRQFEIPPDVALVGMIGRLRPWKGQERFIHMAERVARKEATVHFTIVGGTPLSGDEDYRDRLRRLVPEKGLAERVHFTGHLSDVRPALAAMDVFVHPGDPEPFGLVNVEAMAMGIPVVAFSHGALPEIVVDGETGHLVSPEDVDALSTAVFGLLVDDRRRQQLGVAARARAERHFSVERTASGVSAALQEIV
jgi:glycosyltransferase involved in cell wall biosynthesis